MFVVDCGFYRGCQAEVWVGLGRWKLKESTGEVWVDGESCGAGLKLEMAVLEELGLRVVSGRFLGCFWVFAGLLGVWKSSGCLGD